MKNTILFVLSLMALLSTAVNASNYHGRNPYVKPKAIDITIVGEYGQRLPLYQTHGGYRVNKAYLQALRGQHYAIEVRNNTHKRVGFVIAVDGRNVITGRASYLKSNEKMYVLNPYQVSTIRGWRSSGNTINRFYFSDEIDSYAAAFGDHSAMGVIAVAAFNEQRPSHPPHNIANKNGKQPQARGAANAQAGTGWGEVEHSPTRQVRFVAKSHPFAKHLIKYEWHQSLCDKGIIDCHIHQLSKGRKNRLWDTDGYAPPPRRLSISR